MGEKSVPAPELSEQDLALLVRGYSVPEQFILTLARYIGTDPLVDVLPAFEALSECAPGGVVIEHVSAEALAHAYKECGKDADVLGELVVDAEGILQRGPKKGENRFDTALSCALIAWGYSNIPLEDGYDEDSSAQVSDDEVGDDIDN